MYVLKRVDNNVAKVMIRTNINLQCLFPRLTHQILLNLTKLIKKMLKFNVTHILVNTMIKEQAIK